MPLWKRQEIQEMLSRKRLTIKATTPGKIDSDLRGHALILTPLALKPSHPIGAQQSRSKKTWPNSLSFAAPRHSLR
jgi:hypothetical protein